MAYKLLIKRLEKRGYIPIPLTNGLFKHTSRKTIFALCVNDFGIKYHSNDDSVHLQTTLEEYYDVSVSREGRNHCGLSLTWHYDKGYIDIKMPGYVAEALKKFQHPSPIKLQYEPHTWNKPAYGPKSNMHHKQITWTN